jgi:hypothetical protein
MSVSEPPEDPNAWNPDDTSAVPVGPEPEPTGAGGAGGAGGWGSTPRTEPFAIAALVWAVVSIVIPVVGTIVAFALAARAADLIRRSHGEKSGRQYVTAARIVAGAVLALWIVGLIGFLALRDDGSDNDNVAVPTQPPSTIAAATTTTTTPPVTTTTVPPVTTTVTVPPPTITIVPPPPTTAAPPPTTVTPTTAAPPTTDAPPPTTEAPPTTEPPPTTSPDEGKAAKVQAKLVNRVGDSNRGVPDDERFVVSYTPSQDLIVTWAINNGSVGEEPTGLPTCNAPPTDPPASTTTSTTAEPTTTTEPDAPESTTTTTAAGRTTQEQARYEAKQILASIRPQLTSLKLDVPGVQLVGTYPLDGTTDDDVVQALYTKATVQAGIGEYKKAFNVPPAEAVQCLNPAFELS